MAHAHETIIDAMKIEPTHSKSTKEKQENPTPRSQRKTSEPLCHLANTNREDVEGAKRKEKSRSKNMPGKNPLREGNSRRNEFKNSQKQGKKKGLLRTKIPKKSKRARKGRNPWKRGSNH